MPADVWAIFFSKQTAVVQSMMDNAAAGLAIAEGDGIAHQKLSEMHHFYAFMLRELPALMSRWRAEQSS